MRPRVLPEAEEELRSAAVWYNLESQGLGDDFADAIGLAFDAITNRPRLYPKLGKTRPDQEFRSFLLHRFPYSVHYLVTADEVVVFAIAHASRRPDYWKGRKG